MTIKAKLVIGSVLNLALVILVVMFAANDMTRVLDKFRFMEIQDDLNATLLEMRLAEKNLFLFADKTALDEIATKLTACREILTSSREAIVRGAGAAGYRDLEDRLTAYAAAVALAKSEAIPGPDAEQSLRGAGRALREYSTALVRRERSQVNAIIASSKRTMTFILAAVVVSAVMAAPLLFYKVLASLKKLKELAGAIAEGNFRQIPEPTTNDELDAVVRAVNTMSRQLRSREAEILQSKKLASLGTLTAGVAHEITNPVNNISMIAQTLDEVYADLSDAERLDMVRQVGTECGRIQRIVARLLDFSRTKKARARPLAVGDLVKDTLRLVRNQLHVSNLELTLNLAEDLPLISADPSQMQQVLINCITNAIQAMHKGGALTIATAYDPDTGAVRITIADTGKGIPPEVLPHIFDPFFTTKGTEGTGLGLSVSYGIVKNHNGKLLVDSKPGQGTTCTIELPAVVSMEEPHGHA